MHRSSARGSTQSSARSSTQSSTRSSARSSTQSSVRSSMYRGSARGSTRSSAYGGSASGPRYIPDSLYTCLCQVYPLYSHLIFFTLPSFLTSSLPREAPERQPAEDRRQNQTTVAGTRRSPEPDDNRSNDQLANTINDSIDRSN
jgi:hypothetical protein